MNKPDQASGYSKEVTENCERVLVTLLRGLGPWKDSICLVGGLTPRYLTKTGSSQVQSHHVGTVDVDIVVELQMLTDTEAYHSLEKNFKKLGFERGENDEGKTVSWRWKKQVEKGATIILELLADNPELSGGEVRPLPTKGNISALNIPHASMVFGLHEAKEITAELLGGNGVTTETVRYADIVSFTCLKAFAFNDRYERKDAYDLVYCLENHEGGWKAAIKAFRHALKGEHKEVIEPALEILKKRFADDGVTDGYRKDGPAAVAIFEMGEDAETKDGRILRQRQVSDLVMDLLKQIGDGNYCQSAG